MPDFSRPEYASYVQLCRELKLERELHRGDKWTGDYGRIYIAEERMRSVHDVVWLPSLADWLEMLEAAGYDYVRFWPRANPRSWECEAQGINAPIVTTAYSGGSVFGSREEAAARLYIAITRFPGAPAPPSAAR